MALFYPRTRIGATGYDPRSGGLGRLEQSLPEDPLQFGLQFEVGDSSMNWDEQLRKFESPLFL